MGLHKAIALCCAVSRVDVDVRAPEAVRAMVGVACALDAGPADLADEVLECSLEIRFHYATITPSFPDNIT
jgi:hypothetical protein